MEANWSEQGHTIFLHQCLDGRRFAHVCASAARARASAVLGRLLVARVEPGQLNGDKTEGVISEAAIP